MLRNERSRKSEASDIKTGGNPNAQDLRSEEENILSSSSDFDYTGVCWACGRKTFINTFGFCEECWVTHSHVIDEKRAEVNALGYEI